MHNEYPKRLIEVDLPIKRISAHARREKSIRHGHISTLHIWWARRPLAACRAVICAALWPDPADDLCPQAFRDKAAELITAFAQKVMSDKDLAQSCSPQSFGRWNTLSKPEGRIDPTNAAHLNGLRYALLDFIADFANWDNSTVKEYLDTARALTQAAHEALGGEPGTRPLVVDPFAGGGAIPLEALRVGADAFASDLNPVAVLLNKVVLEYIPKYGQRLADEVRKWGQWIKEQAEKELAEFYPKDPDGATTIAYLWARTIKCEGPNCGAEVPLMRSLWLAKKGERSVALRITAHRKTKQTDFEIIHNARESDVAQGTVKGGSATCPVCGYTTPASRVKAQLRDQRGGANTARLFAVYIEGEDERRFRLPNERDILAFSKGQHAAIEALKYDSSVFPTESINPIRPHKNTRGLSAVTRIGCVTFGDLYSYRQALAISRFYSVLAQLSLPSNQYNNDFAMALKTMLALAINRMVSQNTSVCRWDASRLTIKGAFSKQALAVVWDFAEANPFSNGTSNWDGAIGWIVKFVEANAQLSTLPGVVVKASATSHPLPDGTVSALVTDPPYFAAIPYGDLSDFYYVWLRRGLGSVHPDLFDTALTGKDDELIVTNAQRGHGGQPKNEEFFQSGMTQALTFAREEVTHDGIGIVVYAEGTTSGWEAILKAIIDAGWIVTSSWPIETEMENRTRAQNTASLQSSVHIVCRPHENADGSIRIDDIGDWRDVLAELPKRIHEWMPRLAQEGVVGADAIFACLGPALELFSRYSRVEKASGEVVTLREYLEQVWAVVAQEALGMVFQGADAAGFEEDARLTAIWFWVLKAAVNGNGKAVSTDSTDDEEEADELQDGDMKPNDRKKVRGYTMEYDAARKLAQGLGADLRGLSQPGGIITIQGRLATLNGVASREQYLIGLQLSLFNGEVPIRKGRSKKGKPTSVTMRTVNVRQTSLFGEQPSPPSNSDQPLLPSFKSLDDVRPLMERMLESGATTLDRLHQTMLLFGRGQTALLGPFLLETHMGNNSRFWLLAQALSALYPSGTDEKRWVDGVLARKKGLGF